MFLGVVAQPKPEHDFDGKIFLEQVARMEAYKQTTHNQNFTDDASVNGIIKNGEWMEAVNGECSLGDLQDMITSNYSLDADIRERLVLRYYVSSGKDGKSKPKYIDDIDEVIPSIECLKLGGYTLMV